MVRAGRYFLIFQPKNMLNLCFSLNESQPIYAYGHAQIKKFPFWQKHDIGVFT